MVIHYQTVKRSKRVRQIDGRAFVGSKIRRVSGDDVAALPSLRVFQSDEKTVNGVNHLIGVNDQVPVFTKKNIVAVEQIPPAQHRKKKRRRADDVQRRQTLSPFPPHCLILAPYSGTPG